LTGAWVDREKGLIACIALLMGTSSQITGLLKPNQIVSLMGPTGTPSHIPRNQTVLLIGGGLGNAVLFSIAQALKANNCQVIYFAGYKKLQDRYYQNFIENYSDVVVWCCDEGYLEISSHRKNIDISVHGNMLDALNLYLQQKIITQIPTQTVDEVLVIGSDRLMAAIAHQFKNDFKRHFKDDLKAVASINSPMQCMMKEICGQCIQAHILEDGRREYVFSCVNQDQNLLTADFQMLNQRLMQNALLEKQGAFYLQKILSK
jgi:NAD(P)H-flavin reductase